MTKPALTQMSYFVIKRESKACLLLCLQLKKYAAHRLDSSLLIASVPAKASLDTKLLK